MAEQNWNDENTPLQPSDWPLLMAQMADADTDVVWNEDAENLSERSREILESEFADYLLKRMQGSEDNLVSGAEAPG